MASKVISIKLDEKDIERLKKYHEALKGLGIISDRTLTMNGLYKHLLLDYLERDILEMMNSCAKCGLLPHYIVPEEIDKGYASFTNLYNLDEELFSIYMQCIKEAQSRGIDKVEENINLLNEVTSVETCLFDKAHCTYRPYPVDVGEYEAEDSFWVGKAVDENELRRQEYRKNQKSNYDMINKASVSEEDKHRLIAAIDKYENDKERHYAMINGRMG